ncbi:hypothetical protein EEB19_22595 [Gordonia sp. OPL2]|nr:hypothetical protein EEB19_22595 [Gordonia sp. OPL2]
MTTDPFRSGLDADDADAVEQSRPVDPADTDSAGPGIDTLSVEADEADVAECPASSEVPQV